MARPTATGNCATGRQSGAAFVAVLLLLAAMAAGLGVAGTLWQQVRQREKEAELLFVGLQYQTAIRRYYSAVPGGNRYPPNLDALLRDPRLPTVQRYLRRPWRDPLNASEQWGLVVAPEGGIMGVYSLAPGQPIRQANFPARLHWQRPAVSYADWQFVYRPDDR